MSLLKNPEKKSYGIMKQIVGKGNISGPCGVVTSSQRDHRLDRAENLTVHFQNL